MITARHSSLPVWIAAAVLGGISVFGFAPFRIAPLPIVTLGLLFLLWSRARTPRTGASIGFAFGLGFFLCGTSWVYVSLHTFGGMPALLTAISTLCFCATLALYPALAGWLALRVAGRGSGPTPGQTGWALLVAMPACWTAAEMLRAWLLTGFPWLGLGYSQIPDSPLAGYAALLGSHGVTLVTAVCAGALALMLERLPPAPGTWGRSLAIPVAIVVILLGAGTAMRSIEWTEPTGKPLKVALLQGNVAQERKFSPAVLPLIFAQYRDMVQHTDARLIVLPETAFPVFLHQVDPDYMQTLTDHAATNRGDLLFGVAIADPNARAYFNAAITTGSSPPEAYRKIHLVPFGEFLPLRFLFAWVLDVLQIPMADFTPGPRDPAPLPAAGEQLALSICYEDAFGNEMRAQLPAATLLVNISNDAWFGDSLAAEQHWQIAQMRSVEFERTMLRANNTGVTGIIGPDGSAVARLPSFAASTLEGTVQGRTGATPYVRFGDWGVAAILAVLLIAAGVRTRRGSHSS